MVEEVEEFKMAMSYQQFQRIMEERLGPHQINPFVRQRLSLLYDCLGADSLDKDQVRNLSATFSVGLGTGEELGMGRSQILLESFLPGYRRDISPLS
ncbi:MAG: hypothetical protein ABIH37_02005 [archaeon]